MSGRWTQASKQRTTNSSSLFFDRQWMNGDQSATNKGRVQKWGNQIYWMSGWPVLLYVRNLSYLFRHEEWARSLTLIFCGCQQFRTCVANSEACTMRSHHEWLSARWPHSRKWVTRTRGGHNSGYVRALGCWNEKLYTNQSENYTCDYVGGR